jgi:hypothetical protein
MPDRPIQIYLGEDDFQALARGSLVIERPVALILTPTIGPFRRLAAMVSGIEKGQRPVDPPEAREFLPVKRSKR